MNDEGAARIRALAQAVRDLVGAGDPSGLSVLDLGAGGGEIAAELALRGASVTAVEGRARQRRRHPLPLRCARLGRPVGRLGGGRAGARLGRARALRRRHRERAPLPPEPRRRGGAARGSAARLPAAAARGHGGRLGPARAGRCRRAEVRRAPLSRARARREPAERLDSRLASLDNEESFWLTRASLHAMLHDAGFASSWELGAPGQPRREQRATVAAVVGEPVARLELDPARELPDPRPAEPAGGRLLRVRLALARLSRR